MTTSLTTSLVVEFASNLDSSVLTVEADGRPLGYNNGNTSFRAGDSPAFLIYKTPDVSVLSIEVTQGLVQYIGSGLTLETEWLSCVKKKAVRAQYPIYSGLSFLITHGDSLGGYSVVGDTISFSATKLAVMKVQYYVQYFAYRLTGSLGDAPILVYVVGEVA